MYYHQPKEQKMAQNIVHEFSSEETRKNNHFGTSDDDDDDDDSQPIVEC